ncbi:iron-sulfur cluster assembly accessory protein [Reichenbachiella carrageenanivorans]|uniref:Iron-sulfur cluster assembly accessory protein n=1 Tax=Reichenbachiella carrageenanivorans TaxID=2979869 RepID=A0ABY6D806_9BACT|nr:iron-sulfur cluster assembly accessory protein [Reichenbachiella carrageenanivorans]UXX81208.1 iron-sulfur cluster assembly accessory protein [Reichenbachiella carrageenanivorans]
MEDRKMSLEPVNITPKAVEEVKNIMSNKGIPEDYALRIGIKGGGCGAMGYMLGFDKPNDSDITYIHEEVPVVIEKKHVMYLMGLEVDFLETAEERGFCFNKED